MEVHQTLKVQFAPLLIFIVGGSRCHKGSRQSSPSLAAATRTKSAGKAEQSEAEKGKWEGRQLEVTLRRFTNREIGYADRHLCEDLNRMQPETLDKLRFPIHYRVQ